MKLDDLRVKYAYGYLTILIFGGVFTSISKFIGVTLPISFLSFTLVLSFPFFAVIYLSLFVSSKVDIVFYMVGIIVLGILLKSIYYLADIELNNFLNTVFYLSQFLSISLCFGFNKSTSLKIFRYIYLSLSILAVIGLVQFLFHDSLPHSFVELPVINSDFATTNNTRELDGVVLFYMNGLFNNPIVYGSILLFPLVISMFNISKKVKVIDVLIFGLCLFIILMLTSRVNLASAIFLVLFMVSITYSFKNTLIIFLFLGGISTIMLVVSQDSPILNLIIDRFTGNDEWASISNKEHYLDFIYALSHIVANMFFGLNINDYVQNKIITDGAWIIYALEFTPMLSILLFVMFLRISSTLWFYSKNNEVPNLGPLFVILMIGGFFNSFLIDKVSFSIIFVIYSLIYNINQRNENV